jgi:uncharacterized protein YbaP (TraB family)
MKKLILTFLLAIAATLTHAQKSILWEISGNGLEKPSYLLGTLKFIGEREFIFPKEFKEKMDQCKIFAIEDQVDHKAQMELNKALHFPKGKSLATELPPEDYAKLVAFMEKEFKLPKAKFEKDLGKLIPLALSINMTRMSLGEKVMYYDIELLLTAKKEKLKAYSLEPIKREAEAIQQFPMEEQKEALMASIANFEMQKSEYLQMEAAFDANDLDKIFSLTLHPTEDHPDFVKMFYTDRNLEWMPKIEKMMKDKPAFIAVGITHLEGDQGLLALLQAKGYTLTPVPLTK